MKHKTPKNIFETLNFCTIWSKIIGLNFIEIKQNRFEKYFATTSLFDALSFFAWTIISFSVAHDNWKIPSDINSNRSFLAELLIAVNGKIAMTRACVELFQIFYFRNEYLKVLQNIQWIDEEVS